MDANARTLHDEHTPLHLAARAGHCGVVLELLSGGASASVAAVDARGLQAVHLAAERVGAQQRWAAVIGFGV